MTPTEIEYVKDMFRMVERDDGVLIRCDQEHGNVSVLTCDTSQTIENGVVYFRHVTQMAGAIEDLKVAGYIDYGQT